MNDRAAELAAEKLRADRDYLEKKPEGIDVDVLPLDTDPEFSKLETERAKLKARGGNPAKLKDLENKLNARAEELAKEQKKKDLEGLDKKPEGIPLEVLDPHNDEEFASYLPELRELKKDPRKNKDAIAALQDKMNDRAHELANEKLKGDRPKYVEDVVDGVPRDILPLDTDPTFRDLETQRATLQATDPRRNANKIKELEGRLNDRAHELAAEQKKKDLENLDQNPEGVPISILNPHADPEFAKMVDEHRELMKNPKANAAALGDLEEQMNERAKELAREMKNNDRAFLDPEPEGVPLAILPLDSDPKFKSLEAERAKLKAQDPRRNAAKIRKLEEELNDRAHELAKEQLDEDLAGLEQNPRGIPLALLNPHADPEFAELVDKARKLKADPKTKPEALEDIKDQMNARADELAAEAANRDFLDQEPEGVPLSDLPLDTDPAFHEMEVERAKLKLKDPIRNRKKIQDLEDKMNARAHELAKQQLKDDLAPCEANPRGISLDVLKPHEDKEIAEMLPQLRALKKNPEKNKAAIEDMENGMKQRAAALADALVQNDRDYLDPKPNGVPLKYLPLNTDPTFAEKEAERAKLKAENPRRNARPITVLEDELNGRARDLAADKKEKELAMFPKQYEGIDTATLKPHDDPEFAKLLDDYRQKELDGTAKKPEGDVLRGEMDRRLGELAKEKKDGDLWFLDKEPEGIPVETLPLAKDPEFKAMQAERAKLKAEDPIKNAPKIADLEEKMNQRAHDIAKNVKDADFDGVDPKPRGIPLDLLKPRSDPQVKEILPPLREAKAAGDKKKAAPLQEALKDRVDDLAKGALEGERPMYLDAKPEGVPLEQVPIDQDGLFTGLELERAKMKLEDPVKNAKQVEDLEERLNNRAHELAKGVLADDLANLNQKPRDIPLETLKPHENPEFNALANELRELKKDPKKNAKKIGEVEDKMNDLADKLADALLAGDRDYLVPDPEGIPVDILPLDTDPAFHALEVERAVLKAEDPVKNRDKIADLEDELNARAAELAVQQKKDDLSGLDQAPLGVPISLLHPHDDPTFAALLPELRRLQKSPEKNKKKIEDIQDKLNDKLNDLAQEYLDNDRPTYLDPAPNGVPLSALPLDTDAEFKTLESERLDLISKNPKLNADAIADLENALNERAAELADDFKKKNRDFLDPEPEGVPLSILPLDTDRKFNDLENRRAALMADNPKKNADAIRDLEDQMNDRAHELAREQIAEDLRNINPNPLDIPLNLLRPHDDPEFARMVNVLRALKADPDADPEKIEDLEADMNDRVNELAEDALMGDRDLYLDPNPEGIPLAQVPIESDPLYHQLEAERTKLVLEDPVKNKDKIDELGQRLNDRAHDLAKQVKEQDLDDLPLVTRGLPLNLLNPHNDSAFADLAAKERDLKKPENKSRSIDVEPLAEQKKQRLDELAKNLLENDRPLFLDPNPEGIPYAQLPLDDDPAFHDMEVERMVLKHEDPKKNAEKIKDLEGKLNDRAHELAKEALANDRKYLDEDPEGVPLSDLPLDTDPKFSQMETERARLKARDPELNANKIKSLEDKLNARAHELAKDQLAKDLEGLDQNPRGIPIADLNPHQDPTFASFLPELRRLKQDPQKNQAKIKDLQANMDNRLDELAKEKIDKDRAFLDPEPEGIPLNRLPLDDDKQFKDMEKGAPKCQPRPPP
ncbi:calpain-like cysteine peptidase [Angomonas deanei]|uniref:DUF7623 domain-containing protein n=1 Tax=Angomonas deanei TaxID=59799 RepID=A0A7G2C6K4_9TRYP|nr:calpain-like cysteine peptidase [Angomonas deanei]CAD2215400.1 hypothetical protein, conserved [Angomonas deanei]|eukprot:EPY25974.1 calpain-like cysteine peptidase [Angomonas deanei]